jgi:transcription elongation factor GreA
MIVKEVLIFLSLTEKELFLQKNRIMEYMSQEGYDKLVAELHHMESVELPQVRDAISEARDKGDLSENFEYHAAKREQARLLGRIRFKQKVLANARVIDMSRLGTDSVQLLSKVEMTNLATNARMTYTIASPNEANLREGKISVKSPIAQALLNKRVGDVVEVRVPAGMMKLRIESISL